jgi:hypothetical protein
MKIAGLFLSITLVAAGFAFAQQQDEDARRKQAEFRQRSLEQLTPEERAHLQSNGKVNRAEWIKEHPARESTGMIALPDLGKGMYQGEQGGLYPNGKNTPPNAHLKAGLAIARRIAPLDAEGRESKDGKIVLISTGMSNTTMKFQTFQKLAGEEHGLNPRLVLVDGAQGGQVAWITSKPHVPYWDVDDERLTAAGVTPRQVQVAWILQANPGPNRPFPAEVKELQHDIVETLHVMHDRFPNLKIAYLSSRTYAGYATSPLNPEPHAYETGFAVKWLIADQIAGKAELNYDASKGPVVAPWCEWGPYLWADGIKPNRDGLSYVRADYSDQDGTHPSPSGRLKVATRLMHFLKTDPTARSWFTAEGGQSR